MSRARKHYDLLAWQEAIALVTKVYSLTQCFPDTERYALVQQMRRAAVSVPSNIAEGVARNSKQEFSRFLAIARGSLSELDTQLIIARNLGYVSEISEIESCIDPLFSKISALINSLKAKEV
ncbi:MAG: four helix bundle protein [Gammaproteobacteria bacterium]